MGTTTVIRTGAATSFLDDNSPAHMWPEAHDPANQWLANHKGRRQAELDVMLAGNWAMFYVRGALDPAYRTQVAAQREYHRLRDAGASAAAHGFRAGMMHRARIAFANVPQRYALGVKPPP